MSAPILMIASSSAVIQEFFLRAGLPVPDFVGDGKRQRGNLASDPQSAPRSGIHSRTLKYPAPSVDTTAMKGRVYEVDSSSYLTTLRESGGLTPSSYIMEKYRENERLRKRHYSADSSHTVEPLPDQVHADKDLAGPSHHVSDPHLKSRQRPASQRSVSVSS